MERRTISVRSNENTVKKINQTKCNEMIISDILTPLLNIIYEMKKSKNYNDTPNSVNSKKDGWEYYGDRFNEIYKAINGNIFLSEYEYRKIYQTVQGIQSFTRKFSYADGLPDYFFEVNQNLLYYTFAFSEDGKRCKEYLQIPQENAPSDREYRLCEEYHRKNIVKNERLNLQFDKDDFFIEELACTVRKIFINIISNQHI